MFNRPWLLIPVPAEWKREGDVTRVTRYNKFRTEIHGAYSLENLPVHFFEDMKCYDEKEAAAEKAAIEVAQQGGDE